MTPEELVEIEKIRQLKSRYFRTMDQKDWDAWEQVFCEDVKIDTTQDGAPPINGRAAFRKFLSPLLQNVKTVHHGHMSEVELTGRDTARGIWAMEDMLWWPKTEGGRHLWGMGWYYERYRRDPDGEWRILELVLKRARVEQDGMQTFPPAPS